MAVAMTIGATKIQILQENSIASISVKKSSEAQDEKGEASTADQEACTV